MAFSPVFLVEILDMLVQAIVTFVYGTLLEVGGLMGFIKARSKPSLIAGVVSGGIAYLGGALMLVDFVAGKYIATVLAGGLLAMFAVKLGKASAGADGEADEEALRKATGARKRAMLIACLSAVELIVLWAV